MASWEEQREKRRALRRAENKQKRRWKRGNINKRFYSNYYCTCKEILSDFLNVPLKVSPETINEYVQGVASDLLKHFDLGLKLKAVVVRGPNLIAQIAYDKLCDDFVETLSCFALTILILNCKELED